eukprot:3419271-Rhodomonas_salina.4
MPREEGGCVPRTARALRPGTRSRDVGSTQCTSLGSQALRHAHHRTQDTHAHTPSRRRRLREIRAALPPPAGVARSQPPLPSPPASSAARRP